MKTAIYIEDGVTQIVLTPDNDFEKDIIRKFGDKTANVQVMVGSFYDCRGGWILQQELKPDRFECTLEECPPGLFVRYNGKDKVFGFKTEYGDCECFVVASGEAYWGGVSNKDEMKKLMVMPVVIAELNKDI